MPGWTPRFGGWSRRTICVEGKPTAARHLARRWACQTTRFDGRFGQTRAERSTSASFTSTKSRSTVPAVATTARFARHIKPFARKTRQADHRPDKIGQKLRRRRAAARINASQSAIRHHLHALQPELVLKRIRSGVDPKMIPFALDASDVAFVGQTQIAEQRGAQQFQRLGDIGLGSFS